MGIGDAPECMLAQCMPIWGRDMGIQVEHSFLYNAALSLWYNLFCSSL